MSEAPFTREDMEDSLEQSISDSFDVDWTARTGAMAVMRDLGLFELYAAAQRVFDGLNARIDHACEHNPDSVPVFDGIAALSDALFKVRGEQ